MNMGCVSNTVAMATFTRCLLKITTNLIDKLCCYASCMHEPSLNYSKNVIFNTFSQLIAECGKVPFVSPYTVSVLGDTVCPSRYRLYMSIIEMQYAHQGTAFLCQ